VNVVLGRGRKLEDQNERLNEASHWSTVVGHLPNHLSLLKTTIIGYAKENVKSDLKICTRKCINAARFGKCKLSQKTLANFDKM